MNKKNRKALLLSIVAIFCLVLITAAISYAWFSYARNGLQENSITSGNITFIYNESARVGNGIELTDAMPMSDEYGKHQTKYFDFNIRATSGKSKIPYEITLMKTSDSDNLDDYVKVYLTKVSGNAETDTVLSMYSDLDDSTNSIAILNNEKTLYRSVIMPGAADQTDSYRLRMWLNDDTNDGSVLEYTQSTVWKCADTQYLNQEDCEGANQLWYEEAIPYSQKTFTVKVNVYANGEAADMDANVPTIASCPGCRYLFTENTYYYGTNGSSLEVTDTKENYNDVIATSGYPHFLGVILSDGDHGTIERAFACGANGGTAVCVEGKTTGDLYAAHKELLEETYGTYNSETNLGCYEASSEWGDYYTCNGSSASDPEFIAYADGEVASSKSPYICWVQGDGKLYCNH